MTTHYQLLTLTPALARFLRTLKPRGKDPWARHVGKLQKQLHGHMLRVTEQDMKVALRLILTYGGQP